MPLNLPLALRLEKNKLVSTAPWLMLAALTLPDASVVRFARNTDDVTFLGENWIAYAFELGDMRSGSTGKIEGSRLRVANPERALTPWLEEYGGLVGSALTIYVVHADNLAEDYSELRVDWQIVATSVDGDWVDFQLGAENPYRRRFPLYAAIPSSCSWIFRGAECGYAGAETTCSRTLDRCRTLDNAARFGGRPGVSGAPRFV